MPGNAAGPQPPATPPAPSGAPAARAAGTLDVRGLPPVAENLFAWPDGRPRLIGSACAACATLAFPQQQSCPRCCGEDVAAVLLPAEGTLWSWTVQRFPPKSPPYAGAQAEFRPFAVGYVALDGGIAVQGRLTGAATPDGYRIGMPMRLVIEPFPRSDGTTVAAYAFAPGPAGSGGSLAGAPGEDRGAMTGSLAIAGIGIYPFGRHEDVPGLQMAVTAARAALADAGVSWPDIQFAVGGSDSAGRPDTMVSRLGLTGLPFTNVINGCATGGASLLTARDAIASGAHEIGLVVGFDKHPRGAFDPRPEDWGLGAWYGDLGLMLTTQYFGIKIQRYMHEHGITAASLARVAAKAFRNGERNPAAWRRKPLPVDDILAAAMVADPLTQYMFCSPSAGAVALVVCHPDLAARFPAPPVYVRAVSMRSRRFGSFEVFSPSVPVTRGPSPSQEAAQAAYAEAGIGPGEFGVVQVQDTESGAELMHLAECGLCEHGAQEELMRTGATEIGGPMPVNTDGGCIASGEPIGASGLRQVYETVLQLRGQAGDRQVEGARTGFTHVYGAPGISACTVLSR